MSFAATAGLGKTATKNELLIDKPIVGRSSIIRHTESPGWSVDTFSRGWNMRAVDENYEKESAR